MFRKDTLFSIHELEGLKKFSNKRREFANVVANFYHFIIDHIIIQNRQAPDDS